MLLHCCFPKIREIAAAGNAFSSSSFPPPPVIDSIFLVLVSFPISAARHNYRRRRKEEREEGNCLFLSGKYSTTIPFSPSFFSRATFCKYSNRKSDRPPCTKCVGRSRKVLFLSCLPPFFSPRREIKVLARHLRGRGGAPPKNCRVTF